MAEELSITSVWTQRSLGVNLSNALRSIASSDVQYVCNHRYPFIQIVNSDAVFDDSVEVKFIKAATGWMLHDYGGAISTSAPNADASEAKAQDRTVLDQINTAAELAKLVVEKGWENVELIAGTDTMTRVFWFESQRCGFELKGYEPTASDEKRIELIKKQIELSGQPWERPFHGPDYNATGGAY